MKRGQITMEALLLYGAAILVVLLAIAALVYFGVLDLGGMLPEKCSFGGKFICEEYKVSGSQIDLVIQNTDTRGIELTEVRWESSETDPATCEDALTGTTIMPGETEQITIDDTDGANGGCNPLPQVGGRVNGEIEIDHKYIGGTLDSTTRGQLIATVS